jgi:hypothetical protein
MRGSAFMVDYLAGYPVVDEAGDPAGVTVRASGIVAGYGKSGHEADISRTAGAGDGMEAGAMVSGEIPGLAELTSHETAPASIPEPIREAYNASLLAAVRRQRQRRGPACVWTRRGRRSSVWRPWWLLGLVEIRTHPRVERYWCIPGMPASCGFPERPAILIAYA